MNKQNWNPAYLDSFAIELLPVNHQTILGANELITITRQLLIAWEL